MLLLCYERILGRVRRCQLVAWSIIHGILRKMIANREGMATVADSVTGPVVERRR